MDINITNPVTTAKIGEVVNGASAATPNDTDLLPVIDTSVAKKITLTNFKAFLKTYFDTLYSGGSVTVNSIGSAINGAASATPNDTDLVMSVDTSVAKKNTWTQIKAFLKTYFDTIYQAAGTYLTSANITQTITSGVTDKAPSEDAVFDALALKQDKVTGVDDTEIGYLNGVTSSIQAQLNAVGSPWVNIGYSTNISPADSTTYHLSIGIASVMTTANTLKIFNMLRAGTLKNVTLFVTNNAVGSNENVTIKLRNVTTATDVWSSTFTQDSAALRTIGFDSINVAVTTTDQYVWQIVTPAWTSNPTNCGYTLTATFI